MSAARRSHELGSDSSSYLGAAAGAGAGAPASAAELAAALNDSFRGSIAEAEAYLAFYEARVRLEDEYVRGLRTLVERQRETDVRIESRISAGSGSLPGSSELPAARRVWRELRENDLREMDMRLHHIESLRQTVIGPLMSYRDAQERIRKRVKEDLKTSCGRYEEMRNVTLPRTRKAYERKCEEVEQLRLQAQAVEDQRALLAAPLSRTSGSDRSNEDLHETNYGSSPPSDSSGGLLRSPPRRSRSIRDRGHARKSSSGSAGAALSDREGDASGGESLAPHDKAGKPNFLDVLRSKDGWDQARKEAPKKINAFIARVREGAAERGVGVPGGSGDSYGAGSLGGEGGLGSGSGSIKNAQHMALKSVRIKREADDADKAYRKVIFDLQTLHLRRKKVLQAARVSVLECKRELGQTTRAVWLQNERSRLVLASSSVSLHKHAEGVVEHTTDSLEGEIAKLDARLPRLDTLDEAQVPYINYFYGECKDLIFGTSLIDYAFSRAQHSAPVLGPARVEPPLIVTKCIEFIEARALEQAGIYRTSAKHTTVTSLAHAVEKDEERFGFADDTEPSAVAGLLKQYLRQLPEPVLPIPWEERVRHTHEREEHMRHGFAALKGRIRRLPPINQAVLKAVTLHLAKVASYSDKNKMTASNLSVVFGPVILSEADHETTSIAAAMEEDRTMEDLIMYADDIFDLRTAGAPILPPLARSGGSNFDLPSPSLSVSAAAEPPALSVQPPGSLSPVASSADAPLVVASSAGLRRSNAIVTPGGTSVPFFEGPSQATPAPLDTAPATNGTSRHGARPSLAGLDTGSEWSVRSETPLDATLGTAPAPPPRTADGRPFLGERRDTGVSSGAPPAPEQPAMRFAAGRSMTPDAARQMYDASEPNSAVASSGGGTLGHGHAAADLPSGDAAPSLSYQQATP